MSHAIEPRYRFVLTLLALLCIGPPPRAVAQDTPTANLPITRAVLFSSGLGYFEHNGEIDGTQRVNLKFRTEDINDLLKSIVLQDLGGGQVSTVTYDSREPLVRTLQTFTLDLTSSPTLADLLQQARGQRIQVDAPQSIEGIIVGVETRQVGDAKSPTERRFLNLKTETGLRSLPMDAIVQCRLLDKKLDVELNEALALLAAAKDTEKKSVALEFRGQGKRKVRVGYIQESPVWKASYRLVLSDDKPPFLQGWAIVENTGDQNWDNVGLSLVSGRPISFVMDLYEPLFVARPTVVPEGLAGFAPRTHDQAMDEYEGRRKSGDIQFRQGSFGGQGGGIGGGGGFGNGRNRAISGRAGGTSKVEIEALDPSQGVASAAQGGDIGELFRYDIKTPVTLARRKSAMLPIVNAPVKGNKVSIYNAGVQEKHPLNGFQLTNSTDLHLLQGPVTVFDGGEFAGDARIQDIPPGGKRLISYAIDQDVEVAPETTDRPERLVSVQIAKGTLKLAHTYTRRHQYAIKNSGKHAKTVLVEQPVETGWELVTPKEPAEKTRDLYRFEVKVEPGKSGELVVEQQHKARRDVVLSTLNSEAVLAFASNVGRLNPAVEKALKSFAELKASLDAATAEVGKADARIAIIDKEQNRIRQNMAQLDRQSDLYNRYIKMLNAQEDEIERLRKQLVELRQTEATRRQALEQFVLNLNVE